MQALLKKMKKLKLTRLVRENPRARSLLRSFLSIPLLPHDMMRRAFITLLRMAVNLGLLPVLHFLSYFWTTWMTGFRYETLCAYGLDSRTNNATEAANRTLRRETGAHHPNTWRFLGKIYANLFHYFPYLSGF